MYRSFEDLEVWKRGCNLAVDVYLALKDCREFRLRDQMNSAAISIPSNIAEGAERDSVKEFIQVRGSKLQVPGSPNPNLEPQP